MIIVVGCSGSGKSLLIKRLETCRINLRASKVINPDASVEDSSGLADLNKLDEDCPQTTPTIGTNICNITLGKNQTFVFKEIGGSMAPLWKSSYGDAEKLIFLVDISNPQQVSASTSLLYEALESNELRHTPILLILNKIDNHCLISRTEMKYLVGLNDIKRLRDGLSILETSVKHHIGMPEICKWIITKS